MKKSTLYHYCFLAVLTTCGFHHCSSPERCNPTAVHSLHTSFDSHTDTLPPSFAPVATSSTPQAVTTYDTMEESTNTAPDITIATFNIRYDNGWSTGTNAWNHPISPRRDCALAVIEDINPHLLGLQEALENQMDDLKKELPGYTAVGCGRDDGKQQGEYAALFFRNDRFTLRDSGFFWLSVTPDEPGTVFEGSGSIRMATWIRVYDTHANRELFVLTTHWDNVSQSSREQSAMLIRQKCTALANDAAVIVMGDLNQEEQNSAVTTLMMSPDGAGPELTDAYRYVHPVPQSDERTFHAFEGTTHGVRIDFIFHDAHLTATDAALRRDRCGNQYPSDHYPVVVTLQWNPSVTTSVRVRPMRTK